MLEKAHNSCSHIRELCVSKWKRFCRRLWIPVKRLGQCVLSPTAYQLSVRPTSLPPLVSFSLLIFSGPLCPLLCLIRAPLVFQSIYIQASRPCWPPRHSPCNIQQKKPFSFWLNPFVACTGLCVCVCGRRCVRDRGAWVILFERAVKASVTGAPVLCWPSSFSDFSPPQLSRMKIRQTLVPVSITSPDI